MTNIRIHVRIGHEPVGLSKEAGISYTTAWRWFRDGRLPVRAEQMATGTVIVHEEEHRPPLLLLSTRVFPVTSKRPS